MEYTFKLAICLIIENIISVLYKSSKKIKKTIRKENVKKKGCDATVPRRSS